MLRGHMEIPAVGSAPDALTSSHSPLLAFSPPPVPISLKWSQEANTTTMNRTAGEGGTEKAWNGDRAKKLKKPRTLYSLLPFQQRARKLVSDTTQKNLYICLLSPLSAGSHSLTFFSFSLSPIPCSFVLSCNNPSLFSPKEMFFSTNN